MKARKEKKYRDFVRSQLSQGLTNGPVGNWISSSAIKDSKIRDRAEAHAAKLK